jgi:dTDP-4-amino-4,6-dideoxygalactose transaminase
MDNRADHDEEAYIPPCHVVPFVDLALQTREVLPGCMDSIREVALGNRFVLGDEVERFEGEYGAFIGGAHCIGVSNGTDALEIALRALDLPPSSEVLVPANSFVASALAVVRAGLTVRFVDPSRESLLVMAADFRRGITESTRVLMPVHLYGQCADLECIIELAEEAGAFVVEDAAQAQGAMRHKRHAGTWGHIAATSFYPGKNLGAWGDAGAVMTQSDALADRARALRNYGSTSKYRHETIGFNCRLDTLQAVVLSEKLSRLGGWNRQRVELAALYDASFASSSYVKPLQTLDGNVHAHHLYVVTTNRREELMDHLEADGIQALVHYPIPIPRQAAFSSHPQGGVAFPVADEMAGRIISLPLFPGMTTEQVEVVVASVKRFFS